VRVRLRRKALEAYRLVVGEEGVAGLRVLGAERRRLRVLDLSSTATGSGVAEMTGSLVLVERDPVMTTSGGCSRRRRVLEAAEVAGRHLAPYLAAARPGPLTAVPLTDRVTVAEQPSRSGTPGCA
jgi:hypothetical protein